MRSKRLRSIFCVPLIFAAETLDFFFDGFDGFLEALILALQIPELNEART